MTYEEYKEKVIKILQDKAIDAGYINKLDEYMSSCYKTESELTDMFGDRFSPDGCALSILMFYPDLP